MKDKILDSLTKTARYEIFTYPHWTLTFRIKNLARRVLKRWPVPNDRFNWPIGLMARGLMEVGETKTLDWYADSWARHGGRFYNIDDALAAEVFIYLYQKKGGEGYRMAADEMYQYLAESRKDSHDSLLYRPNQDNENVAADMIGLVVPFLVKYGTIFQIPEAIEMAYVQIKNFFEYGMDPDTGLPYHAYEADSQKKLGLIGWGRAVGWILMGMSYFITYVNDNTRNDLKDSSKASMEDDIKDDLKAGLKADSKVDKSLYRQVSDMFDSLVEKTLKYMGSDGFFSWHLPEINGHLDTSATAMILDAIAMAYGTDREEVKIGVAALKNKITQGTVTDALGECSDYGVHPQYYGAFPWALGPTICLLSRSSQKDNG